MDMEVMNKNHELVIKYPWLKPDTEDWDETWTKLDAMPKGWREAFGEMICEEIAPYAPEDYDIFDVKEKYGMLRWYDYGGNEKIDQIIKEYEKVSAHVCVGCGCPDVPQTVHNFWIEPICRDCYNKYVNSTKSYEEVIGEEYKIDDEIRGQKIRDWWLQKHG